RAIGAPAVEREPGFLAERTSESLVDQIFHVAPTDTASACNSISNDGLDLFDIGPIHFFKRGLISRFEFRRKFGSTRKLEHAPLLLLMPGIWPCSKEMSERGFTRA